MRADTPTATTAASTSQPLYQVLYTEDYGRVRLHQRFFLDHTAALAQARTLRQTYHQHTGRMLVADPTHADVWGDPGWPSLRLAVHVHPLWRDEVTHGDVRAEAGGPQIGVDNGSSLSL